MDMETEPPDKDPNNKNNSVTNKSFPTEKTSSDMTENLNNNSDNVNKIYNNLYNTETKYDSYKVMIVKNNSGGNTFFSSLKLAEIICKISNKSNIIEIKKVGKNRAIVQCANAILANEISKSTLLKNNGYEAFIPFYWCTKVAIIKGVDVEYTEETILNNIECPPFKITRVQRLNRKIRVDGTIKYEPSTTVKLFFEGLAIPAYVYMWRVRRACEPFVQQTIQCYNCFKFGHAATKCRAKVAKCKFCGSEDHIRSACTSPNPTCINCKLNHEATDNECPEKKRQTKIKDLMAQHNLSFYEAKLELIEKNTDYLYSVRTQNSFEALNYTESFPNISHRYNTNNIIPAYKPNPLTRRTNTRVNKTDTVNRLQRSYSQPQPSTSTIEPIQKRRREEKKSNNEESDTVLKKTNQEENINNINQEKSDITMENNDNDTCYTSIYYKKNDDKIKDTNKDPNITSLSLRSYKKQTSNVKWPNS